MGEKPENGSADQGDVGFEEMLEASFRPSPRISIGDKVDARVISVGSDWVFLDLGGRSEGLLARDEALDKNGELAVAEGDRMTVFVTAWRDGGLLCGRRRGGGSDRPDDKQATFDALKQALFGPLDGPPRNTAQIGMPG